MALSEPSPRPGRRPGPKPRLSREKIIEAAIELGIEQISVQSVATALGVAPASLYRYVAGLDDLVGAALEAVFTAAPLPETDSGWRAYLETEAATRFDLLVRYAGLVPENSAGLAGAAVRRFEQLVRGLTSRGFTVDEAVLAADAVVDLIHDGAAQIAQLRDPDDPERLSARTAASFALYSADVRAAIDRIAAEPRAHLWRKLTVLLDGLAVGRGEPAGPTARPAP
ncbi:TetR/AcrR family transcriptional regulator [Streptomyces sp. NPDC014894]|uniref:TetR/AcrR family transcriptional regulator n=1 Tax=unclassified Streptomyces TaxID=2593676 RepID=UPI0036FBC74D